MHILNKKQSQEDVKKIAKDLFGDMVKGVVDINKGLLALDAELHSDLEALLLENESKQEDLWGINLYPNLSGDDFIEFDSMINIRPSSGNNSRSVDDKNIQEKIVLIVKNWIQSNDS